GAGARGRTAALVRFHLAEQVRPHQDVAGVHADAYLHLVQPRRLALQLRQHFVDRRVGDEAAFDGQETPRAPLHETEAPVRPRTEAYVVAVAPRVCGHGLIHRLGG